MAGGVMQRRADAVGDVERRTSGAAEGVPPGPPQGTVGLGGGEREASDIGDFE